MFFSHQNVQKATNVTAEKHLVSRIKRGEVYIDIFLIIYLLTPTGALYVMRCRFISREPSLYLYSAHCKPPDV